MTVENTMPLLCGLLMYFGGLFTSYINPEGTKLIFGYIVPQYEEDYCNNNGKHFHKVLKSLLLFGLFCFTLGLFIIILKTMKDF